MWAWGELSAEEDFIYTYAPIIVWFSMLFQFGISQPHTAGRYSDMDLYVSSPGTLHTIVGYMLTHAISMLKSSDFGHLRTNSK